jgi:hypothetical protein
MATVVASYKGRGVLNTEVNWNVRQEAVRTAQ